MLYCISLRARSMRFSITLLISLFTASLLNGQSVQEVKQAIAKADSLTRFHPQQFVNDWSLLEHQPEGLGDSLWTQLIIERGYAYFYLGQLDSALADFRKALELLPHPNERARMFNNIGAVLTRMERPKEAIVSYQNSVEIRRKTKDSVGTAKTLNNMGVLLRKIGDFGEALEFSKEAADIYGLLKDTLLLGETYNNIGLIFKEGGKVDSARFYYELALEFKIKSGNKRSLASTYVNLGLIYHEQGEFEKAENNYLRGVELRKEVSDQFGLVTAQGNLAQLYVDLKRYQEAEALLQELLEGTHRANYKPAEARTLVMLAEIEEIKGNWKDALTFQKRGHKIHDSLTSYNNSAEIKSLQLLFQKDQVILENERLRLEAEIQKSELRSESKLQRFYIALIVLLLFLGGAIGLLYRRQRSLNKNLAISDARYRELSNAPFIAIYMVRDGIIIEHNQEFDRLSGMKPMDQTLEKDLIYFDESKNKSTGILKSVDEKELIPVDVYTKSVELEDGPAKIVALRDRRTQERAEKAMKLAADKALNSERSKAEFLANMSHEIRTPMNGIIAAVDMLKSNESDQDREKLVALIDASTSDLMQTLNDILDLSKVEAGRIELEKEPFNLKKAISQSFSLFQFKAEEKGLDYVLVYEDHFPETVVGDALRLKQILGNFLSNALKFTQSGSVVLSASITQRKRNYQLKCTIKDTGVGIEANLLDQIFNKFSQADTSTTRQFGGSGLGLSIAKSLSTLMGGGVSVKSEVCAGSEFSFWVNLEVFNDTKSANAPRAKMQDGDVFSEAVLVAEDNPVNQKLIEMAFKNLGIVGRFVDDGQKAVEAYRESPFKAILMDIQMPVMDGLTANNEIRAYEAEKSLPPSYIVAMTANVMKEDRARYQAAGLNNFLGKPFTMAQLKELLQQIEEWRQKQASSK